MALARPENERQNFQHQSNPKVWSITRSVSDYWRPQAVIDGESCHPCRLESSTATPAACTHRVVRTPGGHLRSAPQRVNIYSLTMRHTRATPAEPNCYLQRVQSITVRDTACK